MDKIQEYNEVMQEHIQNGIIEEIPECPTREVVHYVPHHAVIREEAESTKLRIVYDCSAKQSPEKPSLNDCLETGPPLQDRDSLRTLWYEDLITKQIKEY